METPVHVGDFRSYFCPESVPPRTSYGLLNKDWTRHFGGKGDVPVIDCGSVDLQDGAQVPTCGTHQILFKKRKWKTVREKMHELRDKTILNVDWHIIMFRDIAKVGTATCRMCQHKIAKGEPRVGFNWHTGRTVKLPNGAFITRKQSYAHRSCMVDAIFDGKPGRGCPGCTAKRELQEFQSYKKMIKARIEDA